MSVEEILREYPALEAEDIRDALRYAASLAARRSIRLRWRRAREIPGGHGCLSQNGACTSANADTTRSMRARFGLDRENGSSHPPEGAGRRSNRVDLRPRISATSWPQAARRLPSVIVFRLQDETPASVTPRLMRVISERQAELSVGAIVVVEESRYRLRRLADLGCPRRQ